MSFKKLLGIISVVILTSFVLMLTTSYAWYAFENGSTTFNVATSNEEVSVSFLRGEYINTSVAVPIASKDIDKYSEKNNFIIRVKDNPINNEVLVTVSLVDIVIDGALQNANFKIELYHQNTSIANISGNTVGTSGRTTKELGTVVLDGDVDNNFEVRLYILDNGLDQSLMMNKTFQAKINLDVISRTKVSMNDYTNADINISSITINNVESDHLPTDGYYNMSYDCDLGSRLSWNPLSKTITYNKGSYIGDSCSLTFTKNTNYPLLSEMPVGSYVKYAGTNGCDGKSCEGDNSNYKSNTDMGYCSSSSYKFIVNGWRIGYIENDSAYLISAGAPECVTTYVDSKSTGVGGVTLSSNYYYGSGYKFNEKTGKFSLTGVTSSALSWSDNYKSIVSNTPYTCKGTSGTSTCTELYEITAYYDSTQGIGYTHFNFDAGTGGSNHLNNLNNKALKYCNKDYIKGGVCDSSTAWAMNVTTYEKIIGISESSIPWTCLSNTNKSCGYNNDLIDIGSYYWIATSSNEVDNVINDDVLYFDSSNRFVSAINSESSNGLRPVLYLDSSVVVTGGSGTYEDPYTIANS